MKNYIIAFCCLFSFFTYSQNINIIDSTAINLLDKMGESIGQISSCNFQVSRAIDKEEMFGLEKHIYKDDVTMVGPDKMLVKTRSSVHNRDYYYNGDTFIYYSLDENNFCVLEAPDNIIEMIDSIHSRFGFKFPAADVFYPSLTDDLLEQFPTIVYQGNDFIDNVECQQVMASNDKMNIQLWITSDEQPLPKKLIIIHKGDEHQQYEATFENWNMNPDIEDSIFDFMPPADAKNISIMAKSE